MYERARLRPPLPPLRFAARMLRPGAAAAFLTAFSIAVGMSGFERFEGLRPLDAFLNAAMLLSGEGPVEFPKSEGGKLFAGLYALYAGMVFLVVAGLLLAPVVHRVIHRFHWEQARRDLAEE